MRNIKELLEIMLNNQQYFHTGMCAWIGNLKSYRLITFDEKIILNNYIKKNRPSMFSSYEAFIMSVDAFYWKEGNINPRIEWIKKHIKKNC